MALNKQKKRALDYILPFLIFISLGVIIVLAFQLWSALKPSNLNSEAFLYVPDGKAQILPWGLDEWEPGISGSKILQGDSIKTSSRGKAIIKLYDKSVVRLGENTEVNIQEFNQENEQYNAKIKLISGKLWIKTAQRSTGSSQISIESKHINAVSTAATFAIETHPEESAHLINGPLEIQILVPENETKRIAEKIQLTAGKSVTLSTSDIQDYENNQSPQVISNTPSSFIESDWYKWNTQEDQNPTDFSVQPVDLPDNLEPEQPATPEPDETSQPEASLQPPTVTSPSTNPFTTEEEQVIITGSAQENTQKIIIVTRENGSDDEYELRNFSPGDTTWKYTAATKFDNLKKGSNTFKIYAESETGERSDPTELTIIFAPKENESATPDNTTFNN